MLACISLLTVADSDAAPPPSSTTTTTTTTPGGAVPVEGGLGALAMLLVSYAAVRIRKNIAVE